MKWVHELFWKEGGGGKTMQLKVFFSLWSKKYVFNHISWSQFWVHSQKVTCKCFMRKINSLPEPYISQELKLWITILMSLYCLVPSSHRTKTILSICLNVSVCVRYSRVQSKHWRSRYLRFHRLYPRQHGNNHLQKQEGSKCLLNYTQHQVWANQGNYE